MLSVMQKQPAQATALEASGDKPETRERPFIVMDDVTMTYGGRGGVVALKHFTLRVGKGEFAAIVGPSGCGKSTFLKLGVRTAAADGGRRDRRRT